jgi:hypothetical protein
MVGVIEILNTINTTLKNSTANNGIRSNRQLDNIKLVKSSIFFTKAFTPPYAYRKRYTTIIPIS